METNSHLSYLKVQKIEQICLFELSWGQGQTFTAQVNYPNTLTRLYQDWRHAYLSFYQSDFRGRAVNGGVVTITVDWHAKLVKAEADLMYEFHRWLRSAELYDIRATIARISQELVKANPNATEALQVLLTCKPMELERFPWEAWELGTEFATTAAIQIIRAPLNIKADATSHSKKNRRRARILVILGDERGLDFQADKAAVQSLHRFAEVKFAGWQPNKTSTQVIQEISEAIASQEGWDILFFSGHSNETEMTGGELGIAPGVSISISEIVPQLTTAKKRGLQVAIFNSCSGLSIADALIDLGFSQVVVMREPIHNCVAQKFLVRFVQGLSKHLDIYESVMEARQFLRMEKSHTYPSAYLVPSLFCHPGSKLFRILPFDWKQRLRQSLPSLVEAIALTATLTLTTLPVVQDILLDGRMFAQSVYRDRTGQIPLDKTPPVALIEIDAESISRAKLSHSQLLPMNRSYIAKLMERVRKLNASVVSLDFVIDSPQINPPTGDRDLGTAAYRAVKQNMWLIFATYLNPSQHEFGVNEANGIAHRHWTLQGYVDADPLWVELPASIQDCRQSCPISYLLSVVQMANQDIPSLPKPQLNQVGNLRTQLVDAIAQKPPKNGKLDKLLQWRSPFGLPPLVDYSIPPQQVYTKIPAWQLLENSSLKKFPFISQQVVLIAVGDDDRLGMSSAQPDHSKAPSAMTYWTHQPSLTGGESLAYMTHHFIKQHLVVPIPDLWIVVVAVILGKCSVFTLRRKLSLSTNRLLIIASSLSVVTIYGVAAAQIYVSTTVLLPWFLPTAVFLAYIFSFKTKENHV
ncbi:MAG: CHASE2 domain-containing protein [Rhizonema sp. PD37]|nr:CHASE2 domain-containing protein [Rhizonema sp. PD37]